MIMTMCGVKKERLSSVDRIKFRSGPAVNDRFKAHHAPVWTDGKIEGHSMTCLCLILYGAPSKIILNKILTVQ